MPVELNQPVPAFTAQATSGVEVSPDGLRGKQVVLYFYPKDNTPGCTTEALDFTALKDGFAAAGIQVFGISKDSVKKHDNFCAKHSLGIPLLSDENGTVCEDYGVWAEKQMYGKTFWGIVRATFLIDEDGKIAHVWPKVKVTGHADEVLAVATA